jgi:hypothetical protein
MISGGSISFTSFEFLGFEFLVEKQSRGKYPRLPIFLAFLETGNPKLETISVADPVSSLAVSVLSLAAIPALRR